MVDQVVDGVVLIDVSSLVVSDGVLSQDAMSSRITRQINSMYGFFMEIPPF